MTFRLNPVSRYARVKLAKRLTNVLLAGMPLVSVMSYYATLAHETTHWTRHPSRLARDFCRKRFGDEGYAMEELVAELGSAFLSVDLELTPEVREDHAAYIASWIKVLKDDKRAVFTAASARFTTKTAHSCASQTRASTRPRGRPPQARREEHDMRLHLSREHFLQLSPGRQSGEAREPQCRRLKPS
jgi:hypothetical protein